MAAPAGQRGGWLSAYKRKLGLTMSSYSDFHNVAPMHSSMKLYVGSKPPFDRRLGFDVLVLCAQELQPIRVAFEGDVIRCPIPDGQLTKDEICKVLVASSQVALELAQKRRVLVTCQMGINRSALVAAIAMARLTKMSAVDIISTIRSKRDPKCLFNAHFRGYLQRFIAGSRGAVPSGS